LLLEYNNSNKGFEQGKKLVEYLALNRQNQHAELILDFGIFIAQNSPKKLSNVDHGHLTEEFFMAALDLKQLDWA